MMHHNEERQKKNCHGVLVQKDWAKKVKLEDEKQKSTAK